MGSPRDKANCWEPPRETDLKEAAKSEARIHAGKQNAYEPLYKGKDLSNQFTLAMNQMLRRFIKEARGGILVPVKITKDGGYKRRQDQLTTWSQLLSTVEKMRKTRDMIESEEQKGKIDSSGKLDNVKLLSDAKAALKAA